MWIAQKSIFAHAGTEAIFVARFGAADGSPKGASVRPAKGKALGPWLVSSNVRPNGPKVRPLSRSEGLARWADHRRTPNNVTFGGTDRPGLRPSLDERLGLRPEWLPALLRGTKSTYKSRQP